MADYGLGEQAHGRMRYAGNGEVVVVALKVSFSAGGSVTLDHSNSPHVTVTDDASTKIFVNIGETVQVDSVQITQSKIGGSGTTPGIDDITVDSSTSGPNSSVNIDFAGALPTTNRTYILIHARVSSAE